MRVINLIGQPGAGKSTLAAGLFYSMKSRRFNVELVTEYTKDALYEKHDFVLEDELLLFSEKYKRIKRLSQSVDWVITDSPLMNSLFYSTEFGAVGDAFFRSVAERFDNTYVLVRRVVPYVAHGRMHSEDESDKVANDIRRWLDANGISYIEVAGDGEGVRLVLEHLFGHGFADVSLNRDFRIAG